MKYEYIDHLQEYMRGRVKSFVENIGEHYPQEILKLKNERPDRLIELLTEGATPILRGMEDNAISSALARTVIAIRWAKQQDKIRKEKGE